MEHFFEASSYHVSWFALPLVGIGALNWLLGLATFRRERGSPPSRTLLAMTFGIGLWLLALGGANAATNASVGAAWVKLSMLGTVFVPVCAFAHTAAGSSRFRAFRKYTVVGLGFSLVLAGLVLTTHLVLCGAHRYFWSYYPISGQLAPVVIVYYIGLFLAGRRSRCRSPRTR